mmetsp:Transcript_88265/g.156492  ORF Transcript_88265/g.156492 Transcript_88265/m.156492 type:complete len:267 (-) Transcript_88265:366-1166(-)
MRGIGIRAQEGQSRAGLHKAGQVLVGTTSHCSAGDDVLGLAYNFNLLLPQLLSFLEVRCLLGASGLQVIAILRVLILLIGCILVISLSSCLSLSLLGLELCLLLLILAVLSFLGFQPLHQELILMLLFGLLLLKLIALINKLVLETLQHLDDAASAGLEGLCLWWLVERRALHQQSIHGLRLRCRSCGLRGIVEVGVDAVHSFLRQHLQALHSTQLHQRHMLGSICLQALDGTAKGIDGLCVILVGLLEICSLCAADFSGLLLICL